MGLFDRQRSNKPYRDGTLRALPEEVMLAFLERLRKGCYLHVAAEACGIRLQSIVRWMHKGARHDRKNRNTIFAEFYRRVSTAQAEARASAEHRVFVDDPKWWLKYGPGKEDWGSVVTVQGHLDSHQEVTVEHEHEHEHKHTHEHYVIPGIPNDLAASRIAEAMQCLEELGMIQRTEEGRKAFALEAKPIDEEEQQEDDQ